MRPFINILYKTRSHLILLLYNLLYSYSNHFFSFKFRQQCHICFHVMYITCYILLYVLYNYMYIHKTWSYMIHMYRCRVHVCILYLTSINSPHLYDTIMIRGYLTQTSLHIYVSI